MTKHRRYGMLLVTLPLWGLLGLAACYSTGKPAPAASKDAPKPAPQAATQAAVPNPENLPLVEAQPKPGQPWKSYPTRTIDRVPGFDPKPEDTDLDQYGGLKSRKVADPTGFYRVQKVGDRWWFIDPLGCLYIDKAVVSVNEHTTSSSLAAYKAQFGNTATWAAKTTDWLRGLGFNGTGAWSSVDALRKTPHPLAYTPIWNFMSSYGKKRGGTYAQPGHTGYPSDCMFVFDPEFEAFCDEHAKQLEATKDDPNLLGHFTDNELPFQPDALDKYLALPEGDPGRVFAEKWVADQKKAGLMEEGGSMVGPRKDFFELMARRYFDITTAAIRKHDPNHLILGCRFLTYSNAHAPLFRAAGAAGVDVISVNYYNVWTPQAKTLDSWASWSGRPIMITEWYTKGADSGLGNTSGAGWVVRTQADRGMFYENYTLGLLASKNCVGWHWFMYMDNDPNNTKTDPSNRDGNKGLLTIKYEPYAPLVDRMSELNHRAYRLIDHFDKTAGQ